MPSRPDLPPDAEARAILARVEAESSGAMRRGLSAPDDDWAERVGQRIGAALGLVLTIGLLLLCLWFLLGR